MSGPQSTHAEPIMTPAGQLVASILAAVAASAVTVYALRDNGRDQPNPANAPTTDPAVTAALDRIEARLSGLETRAASQPLTAPSAGRTEAALSRAEVEALVREAVAAAKPAAIGALAGDGEAMDLDATYEEILAAQGDAGFTIWAKARKAGIHKELLAKFAAFAKANPRSAEAQYQHGRACVQALVGSSDFIEQSTLSQTADAAFDAALAVDEAHWEARYSKAVSYSFWPDFLGKKKEAIAHLETLIGQQEQVPSESKHLESYITLGNLLLQMGKDAEAKAAFERGLARFPDERRLLEKLGR